VIRDALGSVDRVGAVDPGLKPFERREDIFEAFHRAVLDDDALPVILIFPDTHDRERSRRRVEVVRYDPASKQLSVSTDAGPVDQLLRTLAEKAGELLG
jgi:hypothetical protein